MSEFHRDRLIGSIREAAKYKDHSDRIVILRMWEARDMVCAWDEKVAEVAALREAAKDAVREWRLHGQLTDSCRPLERALGIHAPFCPAREGKDCECDLSLRPVPPGNGEEARRGE